MFAPAPPRCCTRSSTRKDSETFSIFPSTNWSVNLPGKVMRWSVAMEPVTTTDMGATLSGDGGHQLGQSGPGRDTVRGASSVGAATLRRAAGEPAASVGQRAAQLDAELRG